MRECNKGRFPAWAERERPYDLAWIGENLHVFWPAAQRGYEELGRGALVVDTATLVVHEAGEGYPFIYLPQEKVEETSDADAQRMVREYDPEGEFVSVLLKTHDRVSVYRVRLLKQEPKG